VYYKERLVIGILLLCVLSACASHVPARVEKYDEQIPIVFGRVISVVSGQTTRIYLPQVRFLEVMNRETNDRVQVLIESDDRIFSLQLPAGEYELTRVQIAEGPFMSMADYSSTFRVASGKATYVGTWRFGIDIPRYGRMAVLSVISTDEDKAEAERQLIEEFPHLNEEVTSVANLSPPQAEARLYEVMPYPLYPRYFRRHWW
jgi:hypothetical protein